MSATVDVLHIYSVINVRVGVAASCESDGKCCLQSKRVCSSVFFISAAADVRPLVRNTDSVTTSRCSAQQRGGLSLVQSFLKREGSKQQALGEGQESNSFPLLILF